MHYPKRRYPKAMMPKASPVKVTKADGTVYTQEAFKTKKQMSTKVYK